MKKLLFSMITLFCVATLFAPNSYSLEVNENNTPLGVPARTLSDETFIFPATGDARLTASGSNFWNAGDYVQGTRTFTSSASNVDMTLIIENNFLSCDTQDHDLKIDGIVIGSFSVSSGDIQVVQTFSFSAITAGSHIIRIETKNTVSPGCGSAGFPNDLSTLVFSNSGPGESLTISPASGKYVTTQGFDLTLIIEAPGLSVIGGSATLDGSTVTSALVSCVKPGTLASGGQTFRCPGLKGSTFGTGTHTLGVSLNLSNGSNVNDTVTWEVSGNTEP